MSTKPRVPLWERIFSNGPRHCDPARGGGWILRPTQGSTDYTQPCETWREHRLQRGRTEWLRFIHAFGQQVELNAFASDDPAYRLVNIYEGTPFADGRLWYTELYLWGNNPTFKVGLDNPRGVARIEAFSNMSYLHDSKFLAAITMAEAFVEQEYLDEEEAA